MKPHKPYSKEEIVKYYGVKGKLSDFESATFKTKRKSYSKEEEIIKGKTKL